MLVSEHGLEAGAKLHYIVKLVFFLKDLIH